MKRVNVIALIAAGLVGGASGVVFAVAGTQAPTALSDAVSAAPAPPSASSPAVNASATPTSASKAAPSTTPRKKRVYGEGNAAENTTLLYVKNNEIHDGDTVVSLQGFGKLDVVAIDRLASGYLVGTVGNKTPVSQNEAIDLRVVDAAGKATKLVRAFSSYDINLAKDRVVAIDYTTKRPVVFGDDAQQVGRAGKEVSDPVVATIGFIEDEVLLITRDSGAKQKAARWNPKTAKVRTVPAPQIVAGTVSPGGSFFAGDTADSDGYGCLSVASDPRVPRPRTWSTCEWRSLFSNGRFSPNGVRLLAVPRDSEGFIDEFAIFDIHKGAKPIHRFTTPLETTDAMWADSSHLWLTGTIDGENTEFSANQWIKNCDLDGDCKTVASADGPGSIVLGGGVY